MTKLPKLIVILRSGVTKNLKEIIQEPTLAEVHRFFTGACPVRHEILPIHFIQGQNDRKTKGLRIT